MIKGAVRRAGVDVEMIEDVIMGNVLSGGGNVARLSALRSGLSINLPGLTVDRQCGSGLNAIYLARPQAIQAGSGDVYVAGGGGACEPGPLT